MSASEGSIKKYDEEKGRNPDPVAYRVTAVDDGVNRQTGILGKVSSLQLVGNQNTS
jgi:hypothetical protein